MIKVGRDFFNSKGVSFAKIKSLFSVPNLIHIQVDSYEDFLQRNIPPSKRKSQGLQAVFLETFPVESANDEVVLEFVEYNVGEPKRSVWDCKLNNSTYAAPLKAVVRLICKETGEVREQEVYMGDMPLMTVNGTFVFNGAERVVVNQLHRSPGIFIFYDAIKEMYTSRIIPDNKGSWLEFELDTKGVLVARIDRKKKFPFTLLVKALSDSYGTNEKVLSLFYREEVVNLKNINIKELQKYLGRLVIADVTNPETGDLILEAGQSLNEDNIDFIKESEVVELRLIVNDGLLREDNLVTYSLEKDGVRDHETALIEFLKIQKPLEYVNDNNDPEKRERNLEKAKFELNRLFFDPKTYNMSSVGRYKINSKFKYLSPGNFDDSVTELTLRPIDIIETLKYMINCINEVEGYKFDDIDHLGNRRVRTVNELLTLQLKVGFSRMERIIKERMTMNEVLDMTPQLLISIKPVTAVINEFFGASQLSQFMDQTNPLSELTHKRRLNALGPGGLTRERAGFEVRDVHYTHYGRLCPIETPEGPNIGLIVSMAVYAKLNPYGFLETPYRNVTNRQASDEIRYLSANEEDYHVVAQANTKLTEKGEFIDNLISCRYRDDFPLKSPDEIQLIDLTPLQVISLSASLIPFLEHDDANRALMGSNMQRQAVPLLSNDAPLVGTGMEKVVAYDSGVCVLSESDGIVTKVSADVVDVTEANGNIKSYPLLKFKRTNQSTCINHVPIVKAHNAPEDGKIEEITDTKLVYLGESGKQYEYSLITLQGTMHSFFSKGASVNHGELILGEKVRGVEVSTKEMKRNATIIADGQSTQGGRLALGRNVKVAFMPWCGYNFEDAIILSERLVKEDFFTSIAIEEFEIQAREGKMGKDMITRDIPNISERAFRELDDDGIIRLGAEVQDGDILVGMVTPRGQTDLTPEYRLLHSIFGEKAREVKDMSLRVPNGQRGIVIDIKRFSRDSGDDLPPSVHEVVKVFVAQKRKISVGDKMAGRHGNKGVVSTILPEYEMPFLPDGTPVDIILNPLGVPSRMNIGQIFETQLGWVADELGVYFDTPVFDGASWKDIQEYMTKANLPTSSKIQLRDGRSGEYFDQPVFVGVIYMLKLSHMAEDKMHARSTGPYSLVTQQPLGGKAQFGGQRMGEMEVWALEAYGAAYTLQELLTVKSDDMLGRARVYESIVKGIHTIKSGVPESFNVLVKEMRSLTLDVSIVGTDGELLEVSDMEDDYLNITRRIKVDSVKKD